MHLQSNLYSTSFYCLSSALRRITDGIVENPDADGCLYGTDRFETFVQSQRSLRPEPLVQVICAEADQHSRDCEQSDDRTVLAFRVAD